MEPLMWLLIYIREQLWQTLPDVNDGELATRSKATLDVIHVLNEIIQWAERSHYGDSGEILPVASFERQAFFDMLNMAVGTSIGTLKNWDSYSMDDIRKAVHAHVIGLDTVASITLRPYYTSKIIELAGMVPGGTEGKSERAGSGSVVTDDDGQRGNDSTGD